MTDLVVLVRPSPHQDSALPARQRVAAQRAAARAALDEAGARLRVAALPWPQIEDGGRPLPVDGWHWSISHDATYVAAVLAREPVGVDLERVAERRAALHDKVADETERELLAPWDALAFTRLWTAKESVLKAAGVGMAELSGCRLRGREGDALTLEHRGRACHVLQRQFGDHVFAVHLTGRTPTVRWDLP